MGLNLYTARRFMKNETGNELLEKAKSMIFYLLICEALFSFIIYFTLRITPESTINEESFKLVTEAVIRLFYGSFIATIIVYLLNCYIFSRLYNFYSGQKLWLRCVLSTAAGELVFSFIWTFIYFFGKMNNADKLNLVIDQYTFKILFEIVTLPITYLIVYILDQYEIPLEIKFKDTTQPSQHVRS